MTDRVLRSTPPGSLLAALRRWCWSVRHNGPRWTLRHVKVFGGLK